MNKRGFTLVELMGVITVVGLISLLIVPTIINQIRNSKGQIDKVTEKLIYSAAEVYLDTKQNDYPKNNGSTYCLTLQDLVDDGKLISPVLDSNGDKISLDKIIKVDIVNNNYNYSISNSCENKVAVEEIVLSSNKITIDEGSTETVTVSAFPVNASSNALIWTSGDKEIATVENGIITGVAAGTTTITVSTIDGSNISKTINVTVVKFIKNLSTLADTSTEITSVPACVTNGAICSAGTPVAIRVSPTEVYNFYVIADDGSEATLIMDRNLVETGQWISANDYNAANTDETSCWLVCNDEGPLTAVATLKKRTNGWTNVEERQYTYSDDGGGNKYTAFTETMRARMLTYSEATIILGCTTTGGNCPNWLYGYLDNDDATELPHGYWLSSADSSDVTFGRNINYGGSCYIGTPSVNRVHSESYNGIRPVITLKK